MMSRIRSGALAGLAAGLVFGLMMQFMRAPAPFGGSVPMMVTIAMTVGSSSYAVGWLAHMCYSAVIGAIFAVILDRRVPGYAAGVSWGAVYGLGWWVLGGLVLLPLMIGMPAFSPLMMLPMHSIALGSLVGHVTYGIVLGIVYVRIRGRRYIEIVERQYQPTERASSGTSR